MASLQLDPDSPLHVLIVGGGLSGLATAIAVSLAGHRATVFEAAPQPHPLGLGWGVDGVAEAGNTAITRWQLCDPRGAPLGPDLIAGGESNDTDAEAHQGSQPWTFHRVDLQLALLHRAREVGATVCFGSRVVGLDDDDDSRVTIQLESGQTHSGDLMVDAEGTQSKLRNVVLDRSVDPAATGYVAYRVTVDRSMVRSAELMGFMDMACIRTWVGKGSYISAFPMRKGTQLSMMVLIPWSQLQQVGTLTPAQELQDYFKGWDNLVSSMIDAAQRVNKWAAVHLPELPECRSLQGTCILVGDAANTMSPFLSQGLSLGLEDAGTIGHLLGHVRSASQLPAATALYATIRSARVQKIREETAVFESHLRATAAGGCGDNEKDLNSGASSSREIETGWLAQKWMWPYDAYAEAEEAFKLHPF
ncbi:FAD binding domain-containing protein [Apiospora kogelbergensis]|uniref:FAD binding domain-containing protein n=1 Tax=Apiospora kogelbergensis TaxID=1337665 RepID=UPI00312D77D6